MLFVHTSLHFTVTYKQLNTHIVKVVTYFNTRVSLKAMNAPQMVSVYKR